MRAIIYFIAKCQVTYESWKWMTVTCFRHVSGRWYVFRDAPTWFVKSIVNMSLNDEDKKDRRMYSYYEAACSELALRERNIENVPS